MTTPKHELKRELQAFGDAYNYDVGYLQEILDASLTTYQAYVPVQGFSSVREKLPLEAHFVARIVTMQLEDCGACAQLNLKMAVEAGVDRGVLQALISMPETLSDDLLDVRNHVRSVLGDCPWDASRFDRLRELYGAAGMAEMAANIAGSRIYPTLKRCLGYQTTCEQLTLEF